MVKSVRSLYYCTDESEPVSPVSLEQASGKWTVTIATQRRSKLRWETVSNRTASQQSPSMLQTSQKEAWEYFTDSDHTPGMLHLQSPSPLKLLKSFITVFQAVIMDICCTAFFCSFLLMIMFRFLIFTLLKKFVFDMFFTDFNEDDAKTD
ncbi:hypothetical protein NPIL_684661 [Nephila pilipes]|uniref:Uncharacterized protein n=1 Tax=Nephila pilipes TaxID=299642 RepID=A0A8X6T444_NEPPI|nr:hypothetical protein NPIL_684661 [Nephila pilipes]